MHIHERFANNCINVEHYILSCKLMVLFSYFVIFIELLPVYAKSLLHNLTYKVPLVVWLIGCLVGWLVGCLLVGWLVGWLFG